MRLLKTYGYQGAIGTILALPITLCVLLYLIPSLFLRQYKFIGRKGFIFEFQSIENTWTYKKLWQSWSGFGAGNITLYNHRVVNDEKIRKHEPRHCAQDFTWSILKPISYLGHMIYIYYFQKEKHPYLDCVWERDAREYAGQMIDIPRERWYWGQEDRWPWW